MDVAAIRAASVVEVVPGEGYRVEGDGWSIDLAAADSDGATTAAVDWFLAGERAKKSAEIQAALSASDVWCARQVEDSVSLTDARKTYRSDLRTLLDSVASSDDPASITLPDEPAYP